MVTNPETGLYWHVRHNMLLEFCTGYQERVDYIRKEKPAAEVETRLRLMRPVTGELPDSLTNAGVEVGKAEVEFDVAYEKLNDIRVDFGKATSTVKAWWSHDGVDRELYASATRLKIARDRFSEACEEHGDLIKAIHARECPSCPWNGHTIFTFNLGKFLPKG